MERKSLPTMPLKDATPTVRLKEKIGSRFVGEFISSKTAKGLMIYNLKFIEGDAIITLRNEQGGYSPTTVQPGAVVALFGTSGLNTALANVNPGEIVEVVFRGTKGRFQLYDAAILTL